MVMIQNSVRAAVIPLALSSIMVLEGCKKEEEIVKSRTDLLIGDWKITEIDGQDYTGYSYSYLFKFKIAGDFQWCSESVSDPVDNYCYSAKWEWQDSNEETVLMNHFPDEPTAEFQFDITVLTETNLEGIFLYDAAADSQSFKFIKVE